MTVSIGSSKHSGFVDVRSFGAKGDGVTDDLAAFNAAIASFTTGLLGRVYVPPGNYFLSDTLVINRPTHFIGAGNQFNATTLTFPRQKTGVSFRTLGGPIAGGAYRSRMESIRIIPTGGIAAWVANTAYVAGTSVVKPTGGYAGFIFECTVSGTSAPVTEPNWASIVTAGSTIGDGGVTWTARYVNGIEILAAVHIEDVTVSSVGGDGVAILAAVADGNNANLFSLNRVRSDSNLGYGFYSRGSDSNAGVAYLCDATSNGFWGFFEDSFLGNTYVGCHCDANTLGAYKVTGVNNRSLFLGCYGEGGQPVSNISGAAMLLGDLHANGVFGTGNIVRNEFCNTLFFENDLNNDGTGASCYVRVGRPSNLVPLEFGFSNDTGGFATPIQMLYGEVNGNTEVGWVSWKRGSLAYFAMSLANASEGPGNFWIPNDIYVGPPLLRTKIQQISSGPPATGTRIAGDFVHEASPQVSGAYGWVCLTAGTPGDLALLQPHFTRAIADADYTALVKDYEIAYTSLTATRTVTLPGTSAVPDGFEMIIKDESGSAGNFQLRVTPAGAELLEGVNTFKVINKPFGFLRVIRRNGAWWITGQNDDVNTPVIANHTGNATLTTADARKVHTNTGTGAQVLLTLPTTPVLGVPYVFMNDNANGTRIVAPASTTIAMDDTTLSSVAGYLETFTQYSGITLIAITTTRWVATVFTGTWTAA